jgi:hypothetical protein
MIYDANFEIEQNFVQTKREKKLKVSMQLGRVQFYLDQQPTPNHMLILFFFVSS